MREPGLRPVASVFETPPFEPSRALKTPAMLAELSALTRHHRRASEVYARMVDAIFGDGESYDDLAALPWLPVRVFKRQDLKSVSDEQVVRTLVSSGTTGQAVSRIFLDRETAGAQAKALAKIAGDFLGRKRLPMVIVDDRSFLDDRSRFNARAAGILGFSNLGRDHFYMLDAQLRPDWSALEGYLAAREGQPILLFGFTFIVWQHFIERARVDGVALRFPEGSVLIHGGGWKKLVDLQVGNETFKRALMDVFAIARVHNYYGMVEQVGSIFFECEKSVLHTPAYADILVRDPMSLEPLDNGREGLIQVLSVLPRSYPGHSLLTEDLGTIHGEDDCTCGRRGKYFSVAGRLKNVELRGCSDTRVTPGQ